MIATQVSSSTLGTNILFTQCQRHSVMEQFDIINSVTSMNFSTSRTLDLFIALSNEEENSVCFFWQTLEWVGFFLIPTILILWWNCTWKQASSQWAKRFLASQLSRHLLSSPHPQIYFWMLPGQWKFDLKFLFSTRHKISINSLAKLQLLRIFSRNYFSKKKKKVWGLWFIHLQTWLCIKRLKGYFVNHAHRLEELWKPRNIT